MCKRPTWKLHLKLTLKLIQPIYIKPIKIHGLHDWLSELALDMFKTEKILKYEHAFVMQSSTLRWVNWWPTSSNSNQESSGETISWSFMQAALCPIVGRIERRSSSKNSMGFTKDSKLSRFVQEKQIGTRGQIINQEVQMAGFFFGLHGKLKCSLWY